MRPGYAGELDLFTRVPEVGAIRHKHVLIIGLGMLGSPAALQLARAGIGKLTVCDADYVELGTIPRWAFGLEASGKLKTSSIKTYIENQYPYVEVETIYRRIGDPENDASSTVELEKALGDADLILDAAADHCVSNYIRSRCLELKKMHVWMTTTPGCWGGVVGRYIPDQTGCWSCMKHRQNNGDILIPNNKSEEGVQPAGCRTPTTTGAGFDSDEIVLQGVRLIVSLLSEGEDGAYPMFDWDVGVVNLRTKNGAVIVPAWQTYGLEPHPDCVHE